MFTFRNVFYFWPTLWLRASPGSSAPGFRVHLPACGLVGEGEVEHALAEGVADGALVDLLPVTRDEARVATVNFLIGVVLKLQERIENTTLRKVYVHFFSLRIQNRMLSHINHAACVLSYELTYKGVAPRVGALPRRDLVAAHVGDVEGGEVDLPLDKLLLDLVGERDAGLVDQVGDDVEDVDLICQVLERHRALEGVPGKTKVIYII